MAQASTGQTAVVRGVRRSFRWVPARRPGLGLRARPLTGRRRYTSAGPSRLSFDAVIVAVH
jgi:hypothetical protein